MKHLLKPALLSSDMGPMNSFKPQILQSGIARMLKFSPFQILGSTASHDGVLNIAKHIRPPLCG